MAGDSADRQARIEELESEVYGFESLPLETFRGMSDEAIEEHGGIGPKTREKINAALAELDDLKAQADAEPDPKPEPEPEPEPVAATPGPKADEKDAKDATDDSDPTPVDAADDEPAPEEVHADTVEPTPASSGQDAPTKQPVENAHDDLPDEPNMVLIGVIVLAALLMIIALFMLVNRSGEGGEDNSQEIANLRAEITEYRQAVSQIGQTVSTMEGGLVDQAQLVADKALERNFGEALEHLNAVAASVEALKQAAEATPSAERAEGQMQAVTTVEEALTAARDTLTSDEASLSAAEEVAQALVEAARGLQPPAETQ